ncbi:MAG: hypothetical protein ABIS20_01585 [Thermoanaerobaculia bacterium]
MRDWLKNLFAAPPSAQRREGQDLGKEPTNDSGNIGETLPGRLVNSGPSETAFLKLLERVKTMDVSLQGLGGLLDRVNDLEKQLEELRLSLPSAPASSGGGSENLKKRNYDDMNLTLQSEQEPPFRKASARGNKFTIDTLDRSICQALADQTSTGLEIESLLADLRSGTPDVPLVVEYVGQRIGNRWQIAVFVLPSNQGLAVVSPGGLADSEVSTFFEVDYGRRIFACIQPARVERSGTGKEFTVRRKGRVESS